MVINEKISVGLHLKLFSQNSNCHSLTNENNFFSLVIFLKTLIIFSETDLFKTFVEVNSSCFDYNMVERFISGKIFKKMIPLIYSILIHLYSIDIKRFLSILLISKSFHLYNFL